MRLWGAVTALSLTLSIGGPAQATQRPAHFLTINAVVCFKRITLRSKPIPREAQIFAARPFVAGHEISTVGIGRITKRGSKAVEGSGFGVLVRIYASHKTTAP